MPWALLSAVGLFVALHLGLSSLPVRGALLARLGQARFLGLYSLVMAVLLMSIIGAWTVSPLDAIYVPPLWTRWIPSFVMPVAIWLILTATTPSPHASQDAVVGVHRIVRHPMLAGIALWAVAHLVTNGEVRSLVLFGGLLALCLLGMVHIDYRKRRTEPESFQRRARLTSRIPFGAIARGDQQLVIRELLDWRLAAAVVAVPILLFVHEWVVGVSAFPL